MIDNRKKRGKADRRRVALKQDHEREYLLVELQRAEVDCLRAKGKRG